jgi:hypothetical protein
MSLFQPPLLATIHYVQVLSTSHHPVLPGTLHRPPSSTSKYSPPVIVRYVRLLSTRHHKVLPNFLHLVPSSNSHYSPPATIQYFQVIPTIQYFRFLATCTGPHPALLGTLQPPGTPPSRASRYSPHYVRVQYNSTRSCTLYNTVHVQVQTQTGLNY